MNTNEPNSAERRSYHIKFIAVLIIAFVVITAAYYGLKYFFEAVVVHDNPAIVTHMPQQTPIDPE